MRGWGATRATRASPPRLTPYISNPKPNPNRNLNPNPNPNPNPTPNPNPNQELVRKQKLLQTLYETRCA